MTVLVLARDQDPTTDAVVSALADRDVPVFRTDTAAFPQDLGMEAVLRDGTWTGLLRNAHRSVRLEDVTAVWQRNPGAFRVSEALSAPHQRFCVREARWGFAGVLAALDVVWANHPNRCADAVFKPYQWAMAAQCGFIVADTAVTTVGAAARRFAHGESGRVVTKALGASGVIEDGVAKVAFTRPVTAGDLTDEAVALTATTVQAAVPKQFEVRLTVVGSRLFPVAIHAHSAAARRDWRSDPSALRYEIVDVPADVADATGRYMTAAGLAYAGVDLVVTPDGRWVFLEANTGPQFGWIEAATGAPITTALAELLAGAQS